VRLETLEGRWNSRLLTLARLRVALSLRSGEREPGMSREMWAVMGSFTDVANLLERGYIDIEEVEDNWGLSLQVWTALLREPMRRSARAKAIQRSWTTWNPWRHGCVRGWSHAAGGPRGSTLPRRRGGPTLRSPGVPATSS